ncbi:MAG TPA: hypothetical protein VKB93_28745 [Thermoanaerobaculia bacterium]|nr:hypothetical protein [Thermoanaerobaculia bacterium]
MRPNAQGDVMVIEKKIDETRIAEEIVSVLPAGIARACSPDRDSIRYTVRGEGMKLRTIVLRRASLQKLAEDADRAVKVEYLQRDLLASAGKRIEFRYPRLSHFLQLRQMPLVMPFASVV